MTISENFIWSEKYRPKTVAETILPDDLKAIFQTFVDQKNIPNLMLTGRAGVGKTTIAKAMLNELGVDYIVINGSMNGNIDTLRVEIANFASTVSFSGGRKYVILDEADYLNCLEENETVILADGSIKALKDLTDDEYDVLSFNTETKQFEPDKAMVVSRLDKEVFDVELDNGVVITVTELHPFIVKDKDGNITQRTIKDGLDGYEIILK